MAMVRVCLAMAVLLASCWSPVFNESVSLAALSAAKMRHDLDLTVTLNSVPNAAEFRLYASRQVDPPFLVVAATDLEGIRIQTWQKVSGTYQTVGQSGATYTNAVSEPSVVSIGMGLNTDTTQGYILHAPTLWTGRLQGFSQATSFTTPDWNRPGGVTAPQYHYAALAQSYYPPQPATVFPLLFDNGTGDTVMFSEGDGDIGTGPDAAGAWYAPAPFDLPRHYGWMAVNPNTLEVLYTVAEKDVEGNYATYGLGYKVGLPAVLGHWNRKDRIVAWLSTDEYLSREGGYYHVVDADFKVKYTFPAGNLAFMDEVDDGSTVVSRFASVVQVTDGNGGESNDYQLDIYSIPTSKLKTLQ